MMLADKKVFVGRFKSRGDRMREFGERAKQFTNLYIKNLPESWTDEKMEEEFKVFGEILSHKVCTWNFFIQDATIFRLHSIMKPERANALVSSHSKSMIKPKLLSKQWMEKRLMERFGYIIVFDWLPNIYLTFTGLENLLWTCPEESRT